MQRRQLNKARNLDEDWIKDGIANTLRTREGRRFLWRLFEWTDILGNCFRDTDRDTAFALGQQNVGQKLLAKLEEVDSGAWLKLRQEQVEYLKQFEGEEEDGYE